MTKPYHPIVPLSRSVTVAIAIVAVIVGMLAVGFSGASAAALTFASPGSGAGQVERPTGVAVDQSNGTVFIADEGNLRVDEFDSSGNFLSAFGFGVLDGANELEVCTSVCKQGERGSTPGAIQPYAVAVDSSSHDVYVSDQDGEFRVQKYSSSGHFILMFGWGVDRGPHHPGNVCTSEYLKAGDTCGKGLAGNGPGEFGNPYPALVVDGFGNVWLGDTERIEKFNSSGEYVSEVKLPGAGSVESLAVDGVGDFYVLSSAIKGVRKLAPDGTPIYTVDEAGEPHAVAIDGSGHLFVGDQTTPFTTNLYRFLEFDAASGVETEMFGAGEVVNVTGPGAFGEGVALAFGDTASLLYTDSTRGEGESASQSFTLPAPGPLQRGSSLIATSIKGTTATLNSILNPENRETKYRFEYVDATTFERDVAEHGAGHGFDDALATPEATLSAGFSESAISAAVSGLKGETRYHFRVVAVNECEAGKECTLQSVESTFQTSPPVALDSVYVSGVSADSAEFGALINPYGTASTYHFEYVSEAAYQADLQAGGNGFAGAALTPVPDGALGASEEDVAVSALAQGLQPGTAYRYRVSARNGGGERSSTVLTLITESLGSFSLPDGRAWELVSPPDKHGALFEPVAEARVIQAASSGNAISYVASTPTESEPAGYSNELQVLSTRGPGGWSSRDISLPQDSPSGASIGIGQEYRFFSEDLSQAVGQPFGAFDPSLSAEASEQTAFVRRDFSAGEPGNPCVESCYRPLVTGAPGVANVPPGTEFAVRPGTNEPCRIGLCGPNFVGATPDLAHVVVTSSVALTSTPGDEGGLYEWSDGMLSPVSVLPGGEPAKISSSPVLGGFSGSGSIKRHAISNDGLRVIWSEVIGKQLYLRDMATEQTVKLGGSAALNSTPVFQLANADDSRVFFTDDKPLTKDSGATVGSPDLYECEMVEEAGGLGCKLSDLTPAGSGEAIQDVKGMVLGASEDGSYVYFVADAKPGSCHVSQPGADCGLYMRHAGVTRLIAVLSGEDAPDWARELNNMTARVSPDGQWLAFMSQRSLTGYDNHDAHSGKLDEEVYLYHAAGDGGKGKLVCASCDPTGARPVGVEYQTASSVQNMPLAGGDRVWSQSAWLAANIPGWTPYRSGDALYQSRYLSNSGRLFFNSHGALVAQDTNNAGDVYEYEPLGVGDCGASGAGFVKTSGGCVGLISSGSSPTESAFLDASEDGRDVFFLTAAKLWPADVDSAIDVYDAHECTSASPCAAPPASTVAACEGESCQAPVLPFADPTPASLTFSGLGNLTSPVTVSARAKPSTRAQKLARAVTACKKRPKRKRAACERQARRAYGSRSKKTSARSGKSSNKHGAR